jgi:hypothetical protein
MAAVSNTSPLLNLAIVELVDLLRQQYGTVFIPPLEALHGQAGFHLAEPLWRAVLEAAGEG